MTTYFLLTPKSIFLFSIEVAVIVAHQIIHAFSTGKIFFALKSYIYSLSLIYQFKKTDDSLALIILLEAASLTSLYSQKVSCKEIFPEKLSQLLWLVTDIDIDKSIIFGIFSLLPQIFVLLGLVTDTSWSAFVTSTSGWTTLPFCCTATFLCCWYRDATSHNSGKL